MNKKQALATILAGLITLNTLGGCSKQNNEVSSSSSSDTSIEEIINITNLYPKYIVEEIPMSSIEALESKNTDFIKLFTEVDGKYYSASELKNTTYKTIIDTELAQEIVSNYIKAINTQTKEIYMGDYKITTMETSNFYNDKGECLYQFPYGYLVEQDRIAYMVEEKHISISDATVSKQEDGTITYWAPNGGVVEGSKVYVTKYMLVKTPLAEEIIEDYLNKNNSLKLNK